MSRVLNLFTIGFGRPDLLRHQHRLLDKHLVDAHELTVIDNTPDDGAPAMERMARTLGIGYMRAVSEERLHNDALNFAADFADANGFRYWMTLDHDVFPTEELRIVQHLDAIGFWGVGQLHAPTGMRYLWPGYCAFKRTWLDGQVPDFDGIRGLVKRDDGDCGSMLAHLFTSEDWAAFDRIPQRHGYENLRSPDTYGLQSYGVEYLSGNVLHLSNASHWMAVPDIEGRERLIREKLEAL